MYRECEDYLKTWLKKTTHRKPLVIRGARQVGKSTLVRQFCKSNKIHLYEINLEKHGHLNSIFASFDIEKVIDALEDVLDERVEARGRSMLFLDEIQAAPAALACLRYFYEERPDLPVIAAGSLLEFLLDEPTHSMPVGRIEFLHMGPMNFIEFLRAKKEIFFLEKLMKMSLLKSNSVSDEFHQKGLSLVREFMFVGGMPECILSLISDGIDSVPAVQSQILQTYQSDFFKYAKKTHLEKIQKVFRYAFMSPCRKIKYANISNEDSSREIKFNLQLLAQAKVVHRVSHTTCSGLPLEASENEAIFKLLALDVGLMNHMQGLTWKSFKGYGEEEIVTEGVIAEQFVGQHLLYRREPYLEPKLNYWIREGKENNAELDFVIEKEGFIYAIEVKAGAAGKIRSLHQWMSDISYKKKKAIRFNLSKGGLENLRYKMPTRDLEYTLLTLPLYMAPKLCDLHWEGT